MPELFPEDQERVDKYLREGVNSVDRKPIKFKTLLTVIVAVLGLISIASYFVGAYFDFV